MSDSPAPSARLRLVVHLLAFVGGYSDAASYLLTRSFTGHLTGNTVLAAIHAAAGEWRALLSNALAVTAFVVGIVGAECLELPSGDLSDTRSLRKPLLLESALLLAALGCRWRADVFNNDWCVVFLCLGMGVQNGALRRCGAVSVHTTFVTGMSTSLLTTALKGASGKGPSTDKDRQSLRLLGGVLLTFVAGAVAGAFLNHRFPAWGFVGLFVPLLAALAAVWRD